MTAPNLVERINSGSELENKSFIGMHKPSKNASYPSSSECIWIAASPTVDTGILPQNIDERLGNEGRRYAVTAPKAERSVARGDVIRVIISCS